MAVVSGKGDRFFNSTLGIGPILKGDTDGPKRFGILDFALRGLVLLESGDELIGPVNYLLRSTGHHFTSGIPYEPSLHE